MTENKYALTHLYHPSGAKVDIPIDLADGIDTHNAGKLLLSVQNLLDAGFAVNMPGLDDGELVDEVTAVARRASGDGVSIVAFYKAHPKLVKKFIHEYLDTPEQIADFESATGLKLKALPLFVGDKDITKDNPDAGKYIVPLARPVKVVYKISDRWKIWNEEGGQGQQPHKFELLRYMSNGNAPQAWSSIAPAMTYQEAREVLTPNGSKLGDLSAEQLKTLKDANNSKINDTMRKAAQIILDDLAKQGA